MLTPKKTQEKNILSAIKNFKEKKILVIGDIMLDQYTFGEVSRISPEAPVPILRKIDEKFVAGGAGNVAANLASLRAQVTLCGVIGKDYYSEILMSIFAEQGIRSKAILIDRKRPTTFKHRFVAGSNHQLLRMDSESNQNLEEDLEKKLLHIIEKEVKKSNAVILSDYAKGMFSKSFTQGVIDHCKKYKKLMLADIKPAHKDFFVGVDVVMPNYKEATEMAHTDILGKVGTKLVSHFKSNVIITRSEEGMSIYHKDGSSRDLPTKKIKVFDVSGAGDTAIAVVALGMTSGLGLESAASLANHAGGVVVQKPGTATITKEELLATLLEEHHLEGVDIVPKLWGYEKWLENNEKYCSKLLSLKQGYQCSLHYHKVKDEMFLVTTGHVRMELGGKVLHMHPGNFVRILPGVRHRFRGIEDSEILEISTHHKEEDSYRIEESKKVKR